MKDKYQVVERSIIVTYKSLVKSIAPILQTYNIKHETVYKGIGMSRSTWERRIKGNEFTVKEMEKISLFVNTFYTDMLDARQKKNVSNLNKKPKY